MAKNHITHSTAVRPARTPLGVVASGFLRAHRQVGSAALVDAHAQASYERKPTAYVAPARPTAPKQKVAGIQ